MTCQTLREAIVDVARDVEVGTGTRPAVECHVESCAACATLMTRERQLSLGLRALAVSTEVEGASERVGARLQAIFAGRQPASAVADHVATAPRGGVRFLGGWVAAAAGLVALAGATVWLSSLQRQVPMTPQAKQSTVAPDATGLVKEEPLQASTPPSVAVERPLSVRPPKSRPARPRQLAAATGFVELPGAVGLPDFESGQIIRVEIPLASLPTYGLEIVPDARDAPVEADVLVGQDGQARAIRLVSQDAGGRR